MSELSYFESRTGNLTCSAEKAFNFVSDIRNFERFIPSGTINNWHAERESCSFSVSMLGSVSVRISRKEKYNRVVYQGDALKKNDFEIVLHIIDNQDSNAAARISLNADLNPMLKMMATKPISQFLEMMVNEMERFNDWEKIR